MSRMKSVSIIALVIGLSAPAALAQADNMFERDRVVGAGERYNPSYTPEPKRVGAFVLRPYAQVQVESNSNVFAQQNDEQSDIIFDVAPGLTANTDWSRHEIAADLQARRREYNDLDNESSTQAYANLRGRLDIAQSFHVGANVGADRRIEARGETGAVAGVLEPGEVSTFTAGGYGEYRRQRVQLRFDATSANIDYKDLVVEEGSTIDPARDYRDNVRNNYVMRAAFAISPDVAIFGRGEYQTREHDQDLSLFRLISSGVPVIDAALVDYIDADEDLNSTQDLLADYDAHADAVAAILADVVPLSDRTLDNQQWKAQLGVSFQLPSLIRGDVALGYFSEEADSSLYADRDGLAYDADIQWLPTQLTTVSIGAARSTQELGFVNTTSAIVSEFDARIDHELKRNIILFARGVYRDELFDDANQGVDFTQTYTTIGAGAAYRLNRHAHFELGLDRVERDSDLEDQDFTQNIVRAGVRLYP